MKYHLIIIELKALTEIPGYWTSEDYINLLEAFDFSDSKEANPAELRELLEMAISDLEPRESAEILLHYKLSEKLSKGQIQNLSIEMVEDNESEEYPDIALHCPLFAINQLLYKSYNGIFQNAKATKIDFELHFFEKANIIVTPELALCAMSKLLREQNPIIRLYEKELSGEKHFNDAEKIVWRLQKNEGNAYTLITSDYWINKEDFSEDEMTSSINLFED
ncbi:hypothetical protein N9164_10810 [Draconibacterium sp.]|nr:hypothetical protein [Draconibacterium sp.]